MAIADRPQKPTFANDMPVSELTRGARIKLNRRVSLRRHFRGLLMENEKAPTRQAQGQDHQGFQKDQRRTSRAICRVTAVAR
jgi:hypothetical protein